MAEPFDLDAVLAEVESDTRPVVINGKTVQVKTALPLIATTHLNRGNWLAALESIMPPDAARHVAERVPDNKEGGKALNQFFRQLGVELGESDASAGS